MADKQIAALQALSPADIERCLACGEEFIQNYFEITGQYKELLEKDVEKLKEMRKEPGKEEVLPETMVNRRNAVFYQLEGLNAECMKYVVIIQAFQVFSAKKPKLSAFISAKFFCHMTEEEIAEDFAINESSVSAMITYALRKFDKYIRKEIRKFEKNPIVLENSEIPDVLTI